MSDFNQLVEAINRRELPSSALPNVSLPQGAGLRGRSRRLLGPGRRAGVRDEHDQRADALARLEAARRCSSTTTTPTAGTTTPTAASTNPSLSPADNLTNTLADGVEHRHLRPVRPEPADDGAAGRRTGPLRLRPAAAAAADLAVRKAQRGRSRPLQPGLDDQLRRVQLGPAGHPRLGRPGGGRRRTPPRACPSTSQGMFEFSGKNAGKLFLNPTTGQKQH